jgi:ATP-dependent DNA ligase
LADVLERRRVIFDGELVRLAPDGKPDFSRLRRRLTASTEASAARAAATHPVTLVVFDVLHLDGPGRRSTAWRKLKHRRREQLTVSGWTPGDRRPETFYLSRIDATGEQRFAGAAQLGLGAAERAALRDLLRDSECGSGRRAGIRPVHPGISLVVSGHGPAGLPLRDAVIHEVIVERGGL